MKAAYDKAITKHVFLFFSVCVCVSDPALTTAVAMMASSAALRPLSSVFASECLCFMSSSSARAAAPQALTLSDRAERQETPGGGGVTHRKSHQQPAVRHQQGATHLQPAPPAPCGRWHCPGRWCRPAGVHSGSEPSPARRHLQAARKKKRVSST